jgi:negative regulator of sigma-B (phosphoserine phosphatase)
MLDYYIAERALDRVNGDAGFIRIEDGQLFIGLVDGAGHGPKAHSIAQASRDFLEENRDQELPALMSRLHEELLGSRGGVAIIGKLDSETFQLRYVGIGNIFLRKVGNPSVRAVTQDGVIGYHIRTPREKTMLFSGGDVLVMHSDGISSQFDENDYPEIQNDDAQTIAKNLIKRFGKNNDDATCVVVRF